ncbi:hypothetical protein P9J83_15945 [Clostridium sporogenes]|uniref:Uncharacterized protein n=1 Tax=Clostridium sporogenes TaxID=1509 RepID=A0AAE4FP51_CLOSG|nr:hypothetical protein [Clostridium sporogenes]MDS1004977.1 hypothetical protein [Clostridium sporogenes]
MNDINKIIENLIESANIELEETDKSSMSTTDKKFYSTLILGKKTAYYTVLEMLEKLQE